IPLMAEVSHLSTWWIYAVGFLSSTCAICFDGAQFAAIPNLVKTADLVTANGRIQASFSAATVIGPIIGGVLISVIPIETVLYIDAFSFMLSAVSVALSRRSFNKDSGKELERSRLRDDVKEGLRYVWGHPVLRNISLMMALI